MVRYFVNQLASVFISNIVFCLRCPTDNKAGDDARFTIDDELYDLFNMTMIQRAIVDQCDTVPLRNQREQMAFS